MATKLPLSLEQLARLCHDGEWHRGLHPAAPSGFAELDASLPGGGWPVGAVSELLPEAVGIGELSLLMPALSRLSRAERAIVWIAPPYLPYAPALAQAGVALERVLIVQACSAQESLWAAEQALRCPAVGAVLSWPLQIADRNVRRLQLAAETGGSLGIVYRPAAALREHSPAALRLHLAPARAGLAVEIHKCRGGRAGMRLQLPMSRTDALAVHPAAAARA